MEQVANGAAPVRRIDTKAKLHDGRLQSADMVRRAWCADIPAGTTLDTVLQPHFWVHYARQLLPRDVIFADCEDGSWAAELRVMFVGPGEVRTVVYSFKEFDDDSFEADESDLHEIKWKGHILQFAIVHRKTGAVIKDHLYPKAVAVGYLRDHLRKLQS